MIYDISAACGCEYHRFETPDEQQWKGIPEAVSVCLLYVGKYNRKFKRNTLEFYNP